MGSVEDSSFHFLVPEGIEEASSDDEWHGRLIALERTMNSKAEKTNKALGGQLITQSQKSVD